MFVTFFRIFSRSSTFFFYDNLYEYGTSPSCMVLLLLFFDMGASAKDPPLKLTSVLIGISLIKILVFYKIFF